MEPRSLERGEHDRVDHQAGAGCASMEPRSLERGETRRLRSGCGS